MPQYGRSADQLVFMPGLVFVLGSTQAEAQNRQAALDALGSENYGVRQLSRFLDHDLSSYPLDGPLPELSGDDRIEGGKTRFSFIVGMARREALTIRQIILRLAGGHGHFTTVGTPEQIADEIEAWFTGGAAGGFNLMPASLPDGLEDFVDQVVPILQRRGLFRTQYEGPTLRDLYGARRPPSQYATHRLNGV